MAIVAHADTQYQWCICIQVFQTFRHRRQNPVVHIAFPEAEIRYRLSPFVVQSIVTAPEDTNTE